MAGAILGCEPCVEPDASTSEPLPQRGNSAADGVYSPLDDLDTSANENEEISPAGHVSKHLDAEYHRKQDSKAKLMDIDAASNANFSIDNPQDSLILEATLRSELFARLGRRAMKSSSPCNNIEPASERAAENEVGSEKNRGHHGDISLSRAEDNDLRGAQARVNRLNFKGIERHERNIYLDSNEIQSQQNIGGNSSNANCSAGSGDQGDLPFLGHNSTNTVNIPTLIFRSVFSELREISPFDSNQLQNRSKFFHTNDGQKENATCLGSDETKRSTMLAISMPVTVGNLLLEESSYGCSPPVDPFWPLCMYELRGKCNNEECPWQHARDYGDGSIYKHQCTDSNNTGGWGEMDRGYLIKGHAPVIVILEHSNLEDVLQIFNYSQDRLPLHQQNCNGVTKVPKYHKVSILPTYLVGLDVLKADAFAYKPVVAHRNTQCWQKHFSLTLATSNMLQNGLPADGALSQGSDERIEVHGAWSKQLSFQWRNGVGVVASNYCVIFLSQIKQAMADSEQAVEMALLILNQEINKLQDVRKALFVLVKALETDPTPVFLWIVYLFIYYGNLKADEKDDMFLYAAVALLEYKLPARTSGCRKKLDDRLAAYDVALSVLCQHASAAPKDRIHESACILDLFLQMMDCLCMSGNVEKAIQKSYGIFLDTTNSDEPHLLSLSDVLNCLTISDKCVFWVCCIYLVIYRRLPDAVVQKFECEKDLDIEWPSVSLSENDKEMAVKIMETAVESVDSYIYNESVKSEVNIRSPQLFALNHLRGMAALDSLKCLKNLLDKYVKLYPSCIELVLVSAQIRKQDIGFNSFMVFEEAISRWPKNVPGIQCIWNQYIANAIHNRRIDLAKEITVRWFHSVWQVQDLPYGGMDTSDGGDSCGSLGLDSEVSDTLNSGHKQMDVMFGFLNLSLYKFLQNEETEACIAVDKARNTVSLGGLEQCIRKHAIFLVCDAFSLKENGPNGAIKKILEVYMDGSSQVLLVPRVLTRKFVENIKKPRVQHLIGNILSPVSFDCSLLNLTLQSWFGSSLLPQTISDPKHLVDFVEGIMEVVPHNFQLAIAVCKLLRKGYNSSDLNSNSLWFWACSTLVNAILDAIPIPPEYVWVEASGFLNSAMGMEAVSERFYRKALSVYPFSIMLWKCFYKLNMTIGDANDVVEAAKERGIKLD
ncbi:putative zinc-finger domain [Sesbania bispinosa]|nr:putative zinc-finger domain [Sesbania bispinosa]